MLEAEDEPITTEAALTNSRPGALVLPILKLNVPPSAIPVAVPLAKLGNLTISGLGGALIEIVGVVV